MVVGSLIPRADERAGAFGSLPIAICLRGSVLVVPIRLAAVTRESFSAVVFDGGEAMLEARSASVGWHCLVVFGLHSGAHLPVVAISSGQVLAEV
jgi:hypothetical protein